MKSSFTKWISVVASLALVSGILMTTANAHIGASHSAYNADGPDLVSATVDDDDTVIYCFDEEVTVVGTVTNYRVAGYDSDTIEAASDADFASENECVEATFNMDEDDTADDFTVAQVLDGTAEDRDGDENLDGAVALTGQDDDGDTDGPTGGPNLTGFTANSGPNTITYAFDEPVDCSAISDADAGSFGYYDEDGGLFIGDAITTGGDCNENEIDVDFTGGGDDVDDAERAFYSEDLGSGTLCDPEPGGQGGGANCTHEEAEGSTIGDHPDLTDVDRTDDDQWTYTFDETVDDDEVTASAFHVYAEDGREFDADSCDADDNQVECAFADTGIDYEETADSEWPLAAVEHCATEAEDEDDDDNEDNCSTVGDASPAESGSESGATDGPDLEACELDAANELVTFFFDEDVSDDAADEPVGGDFYIFEADGDETSGGDLDDQETNSVTIEFDEDDINAALGCGVEEDAVEDWQENQNIAATVGTEVTDSGTTTTGTGGTTTTTTTTGTGGTTTTTTTRTTTTGTGTTGPVNRKIATTLTIRYDRNANAFRGSAAARARRCQVGRLVTLKKHRPGPNRAVGTDTTNRSGNWKIRKRVRRGRFYAVVARKTFTNRTGGTTTCGRDKSVTIKIGRRR